MLTSRAVVNSLRVFWVIIIIWYELGIIFRSVAQCQWPDEGTLLSTPSTSTNKSRILLVADPQILDHRSYDDRGPFLMYLTQKIVDLNLRKNWHAALKKHPDKVIFVGDMMDGGRWDTSDQEYEGYQQRFQRIFKSPRSTPTHYTPGNHDLPLQKSNLFSAKAESRYISHFGPLNSLFTTGGHRIILLDGPGLIKEDKARKDSGQSFEQWNPIPHGPIHFLEHIGPSPEPTVLVTHIPLARNGFECGPLREKGFIRPGTGFGYQNTLGQEITQFLLSTLRPVVVFSGDDHDYCEHFHSVDPASRSGIREVSLKSLSMAMGVKRPGFQLLSLTSSKEVAGISATYADAPCFLPDQIDIYLSAYIPLSCLSLLLIVLTSVLLPPRSRVNTTRGGILDAWFRSPGSDQSELPLHSVKPKSSRFWLSRFRSITSGLRGHLSSAHQDRRYERVPSTKVGLLRRVVRDTADVAVYPVVTFAIICWWYAS